MEAYLGGTVSGDIIVDESFSGLAVDAPPVPEPAGLALFGFGLASLLRLCRNGNGQPGGSKSGINSLVISDRAQLSSARYPSARMGPPPIRKPGESKGPAPSAGTKKLQNRNLISGLIDPDSGKGFPEARAV
ncbi:MAG: PEP-CTERM sorting domain-containing protein [Acetobacteraceae bacterium]|nr:PEP-CTERM sorting domain-containing protein [Acetobacteraceae bacterium]